jgi:hypothetical protein
MFRKIECKVKGKMIYSSNSTRSLPGPSVLSHMCLSLPKPTISSKCQMSPCDSKYQWQVEPWTVCSASCGQGFRKRRIKCVHVAKNEKAEREKCDKQFKPPRREKCFVKNCLPNDCAELKAQNIDTTNVDGNYIVLVSGYRIEVYCHQMNETLPKTYINVDPTENYAEFYGKR